MNMYISKLPKYFDEINSGNYALKLNIRIDLPAGWYTLSQFSIWMRNEGLCTKTGPINLHQLLVTRVLAWEHWFVYQNRSERHLLVFWRKSVLIALNRRHQGYALKIENCRWYDVYTIPFAMSMQVASRPALPQCCK